MESLIKKRKTADLDNYFSQILIPSSIFQDRSISILEVLVEYLKDKKGLSYHEIALLLNRNDRTIWTVYNRVVNKRQTRKPLSISSKTQIHIPLLIFSNRLLSFSETIVQYLKRLRLSNHKISLLLNRSDKTIWTLCDRIKNKQKNAV